MRFGLFVPLFGEYADARVLAALAGEAETAGWEGFSKRNHLTNDQGEDRAAVAAYEKAGVTWWVEGISPWRFGWQGSGGWPLAAMHERILAGPPRE